jgi:hypothetical protein
MDPNEIFAYVIVGAVLVAAAVPLIGIIFSSGKPKGMGGNHSKKHETAQGTQAVLHEDW